MKRTTSKTRALAEGELAHATGGGVPEPIPWVQPEPVPWRDWGPILVRPSDPVIRPIDIIIDVRPPPLPWLP
jgi:hypothetical protein